MKIYSFNGETFSRLPNLLKTPDGTVSPVSEALFLQLGGTIEEDEEPAPEEDFRAACAMFRALCDEIGQFIGDASFQGGFDGYADFAESEAYRKDPVRGNALAIRWSALNELCKYKGAKIGLGQPDWWWKCWELALAEEQTEA